MLKPKILAVTLGCLLLGGCVTTQQAINPHEKQQGTIEKGSIRMPGQASYARARFVEEGRMMNVYTQMTGIGDNAADNKVLFPPEMQRSLGISNRQANRRFMDMLLSTRRFKVYDDSSTVLRDKSDIVIDGMITHSTQELVPMDSYRKVRTTVQLSVQMKDVLTGENLFPGGLSITGDYGMTQGEGTLLGPRDSLRDPAIQTRAANDYQRALEKALAEVTVKVGEVLRPMAKVVSYEDNSVGILGGFAHGLQVDDELVVFRAETGRVGDRTVFLKTRPVAVVRCDGAGTETSQCDVIRMDTKLVPQVGDYAVLSDFSVKRPREK